jgi:hypothetical protein
MSDIDNLIVFGDDPMHEEVVTSSSVSQVIASESQVDPNKCLWCQSVRDEDVSVIGVGLETFKEHCRVLGRVDLLNLTLQHCRLLVHRSCRRAMSYEVRRAVTATSTSSGNQPVATRSRSGVFNFREMCFLCAESCCEGKNVRKVLSGSEFDANIRQKICDRGYDNWAISVQGRLDSVSDLFAADAMYHISCYARFYKNLPHTPLKRKRGRPKNEAAFIPFEMLCNKLEQECENDIYTLSDLHSMMLEIVVVACMKQFAQHGSVP